VITIIYPWFFLLCCLASRLTSMSAVTVTVADANYTMTRTAVADSGTVALAALSQTR
jgi:hypothetical protein